MRRARLLLLLLAISITIVVAVVAVLPGVTDWNRYRGSLEALAGEALGRPVTIAGPVSLSVLPEPVLTASRVSVGGGGGERITVAELRLRVALLPLLTGRVDARSLTLRRPDLHLPWPPWRGVALAAPPWPAELSARIEDGRVEAGGIVLMHVDATLAAGQGDAALTLVGSAAEGQSTWNLSLRLGEPEVEGTTRVEVSLQGGGQAGGTAAQINGRLNPDGGLTGHLALDGPKLSELMAAPALPFHADGSFVFGRAGVRLTGLSVTIGSVSAHGGGMLTLQPAARLDLALESQGTVPLDAWLGTLRAGGESRLPVGLSFTAPRATLARGLLQHLNLAIVLAPDGARIGAFRAILPGDAAFAAEGRVVHAGGTAPGWQFEGTAHLAAPTLLGTVHWLDEAAPGVLPPLPAAVLGQVAIGGRVVIGANGIALDSLTGTIDRSKLTGSLSLGFGGRPAISAGLALDRLDLDPWLPQAAGGVPPHRRVLLAEIPAWFAGMSVELRLTAGEAMLGRTTISGLSLDAAADRGQVILRRLDATVEGMHAIASGTIGKAGELTEGRLALTAAAPAALARRLPAPFAAAVGRWQAAFSLDVTAAGPPQRLRLAMKGALGDLRLTAAPIVDLDSGLWQGPVSVRHPGAAELIAASGFANPMAWLGPGSLSLIGEAAGGPRGWSLKQFRLIAGALQASGSLQGLGRAAITGNVHASSLPVPPPGAAAGALLLGLIGGGNMMVGLSAERVTAGQRIVLEGAAGNLEVSGRQAVLEVNGNVPGGGALAVVLSVAGGMGPPRFRLGAALSGVRLKGGLTAGTPDLETGRLDGEAVLSAEGYGSAALLATLGGRVAVKLRDGVLSGLSLAGVQAAMARGGTSQEVAASLGKALAGGRSPFTRLALIAQGSGGRFTLVRARMLAGEGTVEADGTLDLPAQSEALRLTIRPALAGAPDLVVRFGGTMRQPKRVEEISAALQWEAKKGNAQPVKRP